MRIAFWTIALLFTVLFVSVVYLFLALQQKQVPTVRVVPLPVAAFPSPSIVPTAIPVVQQPVVAPQSQPAAVKEYFIPFGAGSSNAGDWTDVPGLTAQIDFGNYPNIKEVHFEASVVIPTANETASVRLFNVTDKHPVWYSEITLMNGQFVSSNPIVWDTGLKTYQVQMKTSLQYTANLIQSRLHIILQ